MEALKIARAELASSWVPKTAQTPLQTLAFVYSVRRVQRDFGMGTCLTAAGTFLSGVEEEVIQKNRRERW